MDNLPPKFHDDVIARIVTSADGGPIRRILNGRSRRPTGTYVSIKGGFRAMPWESRWELLAMQIAEASPSVHSVLAQPHRLELLVRCRRQRLPYLPDSRMEVDASVAAELESGAPLGPTLMNGSPAGRLGLGTRVVIAEFKSDDDRRMKEDVDYRLKLRLAKTFYSKLGMVFVVATETKDLRSVNLETVKEISLDRLAAVSSVDADRAVRCVLAAGGISSLGEMVLALGGGRVGHAKAYALHVRRVIAIDIRGPLAPDCPVRLVSGANLPPTPGSGSEGLRCPHPGLPPRAPHSRPVAAFTAGDRPD